MDCFLCGSAIPEGKLSCPSCYASLPVSPGSAESFQPGELLAVGLHRSSRVLTGGISQSLLKMRLSRLENQVQSRLEKVIAACQHDPDKPDCRSRLAAAYYLAEDRLKALAAVEYGEGPLASDPTFVHNRAVICAEHGRKEQAFDDFHQAQEMGADKSIVSTNAALLAAANGNSQNHGVDICRNVCDRACGNADVVNQMAVYMAEAGCEKEALDHIQRGMEEFPGDPDFYINSGVLRYRKGDLEGASTDFQAACEHEPVPRLGHYNAGVFHLVKGQLNKAGRFFTAVLQNDAKSGPALGQMAVLHAHAKQAKRTLEEFREAARNAPQDFEIRYNSALFLLKENKFEEAVAEIERAAELRPDDHDALLLYTVIGYAAKRYRIALEKGVRGLQLYPNSAPLHFSYALVLDAQEHFDAAVEHLTWLTERFPRFTAALNNLGIAKLLKTETVDAVDCLTRACSLAKDDLRLQSNLALAYYVQGDHPNALKVIETCGKVLADTPISLDIIGHIHSEKKRSKEAVKEAVYFWEKLAAQEPTNTESLTNLGIAYYRDDQPDTAVEFFKKVLLLSPRSLAAHNNLGLAYAKNKLLSEALHHLGQVVGAQPNNPVVHSNVGLVKYFRGDTEEAMTHWREVTLLAPDYAKRREATRFSAYDDSEMMVSPINIRRRVIYFPAELPPYRHEMRFSVHQPSFIPLLPWDDLAKVMELKHKITEIRRRLG